MIAAVLVIALLVSFLLAIVITSQTGEFKPLNSMLIATPITVLGIGGTSLFKTSQIRHGGGSYVASSLGGRKIDFNTLDSNEKQLANIVEEIAIAAGMPVPGVFILDNEPGINAFAAGWTPENSVIGVTRGALNYLNRNELQGVIAHEFAHIYNGDTKIKTKLIGIVFGIVVLAFLGRLFLNQAMFGRRSRGKNDGAMVVLVAGIALLVIGYAGSFFAQLIQSAVSRQREFLADASGVQFTRDPESLGKALSKIGGIGSKNKIVNAHATESSHLFFSSSMLTSMSTHPPLKNRIKRLIPTWNGKFEVPKSSAVETNVNLGGRTTGHIPNVLPNILPNILPGMSGLAGDSVITGSQRVEIPVEDVLPEVASYQAPTFNGPTQAHMHMAQGLISQIPADVQNSLRTTYGAALTLIGLLVTNDPQLRPAQLANAAKISNLDMNLIDQASQRISNLDRRLYLPAIDLGLGSIHNLPFENKRSLAEAVTSIESESQDLDLFRWVLRRVLIRHLNSEQDTGSGKKELNLKDVEPEAIIVFAVMAGYAGSKDLVTDSFDSALSAAGYSEQQIPNLEEISFESIDESLTKISMLNRDHRQRFVMAASTAAMHDGKIGVEEAQLIRVFADAVGEPIPPLLPNI